MKKKNYCL